ncbi:MAG: hypothetical protein MUC60_10235, partial [Oscillatoria sp. Prado101]|nr:hypothetical protein [Oscillatoria sp. Prado101]
LILAVPIATLAFLFIRLKAIPMGLTFAGAALSEGTAEGGIFGFIRAGLWSVLPKSFRLVPAIKRVYLQTVSLALRHNY